MVTPSGTVRRGERLPLHFHKRKAVPRAKSGVFITIVFLYTMTCLIELDEDRLAKTFRVVKGKDKLS